MTYLRVLRQNVAVKKRLVCYHNTKGRNGMSDTIIESGLALSPTE